MAKKNRKKIKINQRIRKYFDGDPFDVGVERVDPKTLSDMFATLGIYDIEHDKKSLVKLARMLWSESDGDLRAEILDFFIRENHIYRSEKPKEVNLDRETKIDSIVATFDVTHDEATLLREAFIDFRAKKITPQKIESKLRYIRYEAKRQRIQKLLEGVFDSENSLEFNASFLYVVYGEKFHKILTLKSKKYSDDFIQNTPDDELVLKIGNDKKEIIERKQKQINEFTSSLPKEHRYLLKEEIIASLKASAPDSKTRYPQIKKGILLKIILDEIDIIDVDIHSKEMLVYVNETLKLPYSKILHRYTLELHVELDSVLEAVWECEDLNFQNVIYEAKKENEEHFLDELSRVVSECREYATLLSLNEEELYKRVYNVLLERLGSSLQITSKIARKTLRGFVRETHDEVIKKQREALLARTIRDFKSLFPVARGMRRKLILHIGPTNSGKTYEAMKKLKSADTGYYLAPLRLLALEGYEDLKASGIDASLITGEEQLVNDDATHISSTIEMLNFDVDVDVCVIDEVQMIDDADRGWAWANAIIGVAAKEVVMTGSSNVRDAIEALAEYLDEELEVIEFERKNPLKLLDEATHMEDVQSSSAIIAFSRKDVLKLKQRFSERFRVSVVYGNLSPEVRREEARRFREGESELLIATDAIAMGMNLPIKSIFFYKAEKFDGITQRKLFTSEILQIAGRAGRYTQHEVGYVGALDEMTLKVIRKNFYKKAKDVKIPFKVMANLEHIKLVSNILEEKSLYVVLKFFVDNMEFNGPFRASNLDDMLEASKIVDEYELDIATKYHLACAPLTLKSPYILASYERYVDALEKKLSVRYVPPMLHGSFASTTEELLRAEDMVKEISLYLWLSYRFGDFFTDREIALKTRGRLNRYIEESLQQSHFMQRCRLCHLPLPLNSKYTICQSCFKKHYASKGFKKYNRRQR